MDVVEEGKPVEAPEIVAAQAKAKAALEKIRDEWLKYPNVTGIGIGYKSVQGRWNFSRMALKICVERKLSSEELNRRGLPTVPAEIDGVETDVEEIPRLRPTSSASGSRDDRKDPLVGGITVGINTKPFWYETGS